MVVPGGIARGYYTTKATLMQDGTQRAMAGESPTPAMPALPAWALGGGICVAASSALSNKP